MLKEYLTVGKTDSFEMIEKKSKFIATVAHTRSLDEVQQFIDSVKNRYPDATHHVYAYSTDEPSFLQKYSDDGEPSGTAGLPTMEAIKKNRLNNICIVVTRYYGGIPLGAKGLVRAYGKSAFKGVEKAGIVKMAPHIPVTFTLDYSHYGKVDNYVNVSGLTKEDVRFGAGVEMVLVLPEDQGDFVIAQIMDLTGGNAAVKKGSAEYRAMAIR
jgi:uncharacterized YigZ family protein